MSQKGNETELTPLERYLAKQRQGQDAGLDVTESSERDPTPTSGETVDTTADPELAFRAVPHEPPAESAQAISDRSEVSLQAEKQTAFEIKPGGFASRLMAYMIDSFIVWGLTLSVYQVLGGILDLLTFYTAGASTFMSLQLVTFAYYGWFYSEKGATPGKMAMGLEVRQTDGLNRIGYIRSYLRESFGKYLSWLPLGFGFLLPLFSRENKALHDLIFDTRIIKAPRKR